ncbi:hypothetical protein BH11PSE9_BH11PSE9_20400 [soil metagenome]
MTTASLRISVVVTTYKRSAILRRVLDHLAAQDFPVQQYEVIVADDGSPDDTRQAVAEFAARVPFEVRFLTHPNAGPGYTENRGIEAARAPLVLLLADDIFMSPEGVRKHVEFHQSHPEETVAVLGRTIQAPDLDQSAFLRKWDPFRFDELSELEELPPYRFGAMNLSFKRDFMMRHGMFLEHRGRGGVACMEDLELGYRLAPHGMRLLYSKESLAYHYHFTTLDVAMLRWYERGLNYGEFRRYATHPELTVYFHVLDFRTWREYTQVLRGENSFRGRERSLTWHLIRHFCRMLTLNEFTARWFWRPLFELAEKYKWLERLVTAKMYRAFLYYQFLRGVRTARGLYGD